MPHAKKWSLDDNYKLLFMCISKLDKDLKVTGWQDLAITFNKLPGTNYSKRTIEYQYRKLRKEFQQKLETTDTDDEESGAASDSTTKKRKGRATADNEIQDVKEDQPTKKARTPQGKKAVFKKDPYEDDEIEVITSNSSSTEAAAAMVKYEV